MTSRFSLTSAYTDQNVLIGGEVALLASRKPVSLEQRIEAAAAEYRAQLAAKGFRLFAAPLGIGICKLGEDPETAAKRHQRLTGSLTP